MLVSETGSLRFKSRAGQIGTVLPTARDRCNISLKGAVLLTCAMTRRWAPQTRYTLRRNTASIIQIFLFCKLARLLLKFFALIGKKQ